MRHDSIFYTRVYPDGEPGSEAPQPETVFNDNVVLAGIEELKSTDHPGIYSIKLKDKETPIDAPEISIIAHLDEQQESVEVYAELLRLVEEKRIEVENMPVTDNSEPVDEPQTEIEDGDSNSE